MRTRSAALWILTVLAAFFVGRFLAEAPTAIPLPVTSYRAALEQRDPTLRHHQASEFLLGLSPENLDEAREVLSARLHWLGNEDLDLFTMAWTGFDPAGALSWALSQHGALKRRAAAAAIYAQAYHNPSGARIAVDSLEDPYLSKALRDRMIAGWLRRDSLNEVERYISSMPEGDIRWGLAYSLATEFMRREPEAVIKWAEEIPDDAHANYKRTAFEVATKAIAKSEPAIAARWIEGHLDRRYSSEALPLLSRQWVEWDPSAALDWLLALPSHEGRDEAVAESFSHWLEEDREQAEAWVRSNSPAEGADEAVRILVRHESKRDLRSALTWALMIHHEAVRQAVLIRIGREWLNRDSEAMSAWLAANRIPTDVRAKISSPEEPGANQKRQRERGSPRTGSPSPR